MRLRSCCNSSGYLRMRWIGLIRYDSSVDECCWRGLRDWRNSCRACEPSSEKKKEFQFPKPQTFQASGRTLVTEESHLLGRRTF